MTIQPTPIVKLNIVGARGENILDVVRRLGLGGCASDANDAEAALALTQYITDNFDGTDLAAVIENANIAQTYGSIWTTPFGSIASSAPGSPVVGDKYINSSDKKGYVFVADSPNQWVGYTPLNGQIAVVTSDGLEWRYDSVAGWVKSSANGVTYKPSATGGATKSLSTILARRVYLDDFGAAGDGVTADDTPMDNAIAAAGNMGHVILTEKKTYLFNSPLSVCESSSTGIDAIICETGVAKIKFGDVGSSNDCIVIGLDADTTRQPRLENLDIDAQGYGRDTISNRRGEHGRFKNVIIRNSGRDAFAHNLLADYDSVENEHLVGLHIIRAGRHGISFLLPATSSVGTYVNESQWDVCEIRGVSWKEDGGVPVYLKVGNTQSGTIVSGLQCNSMNVNVDDGIGISSMDFTPGEAIVYQDYVSGGANSASGLHFNGGGWETSETSSIVKMKRHASISVSGDNWSAIGQITFNVDGVSNMGANAIWTEANKLQTNGFVQFVGTSGGIRFDPGASGSGILEMFRSAVKKAEHILNNEYGQGFFGIENELVFRKYSDSTMILKLDVSAGQVVTALPTADPHVAGALWNSSGTVHVSSG